MNISAKRREQLQRIICDDVPWARRSKVEPPIKIQKHERMSRDVAEKLGMFKKGSEPFICNIKVII
jgi:hypothetical protein